jgi:divinyl protochlorophyllide a 8-vinyl-reductase
MEPGRIGPNAILQLVDVLERRGQDALCRTVLAQAGVARPATDAGMLPEAD